MNQSLSISKSKPILNSNITVGKANTTVKEDQSNLYLAHIHATYNNTIISISDLKGNVISIASGGSAGFKGARRNSAYAAQCAAEQVIKKLQLGFTVGTVNTKPITSTSNATATAAMAANITGRIPTKKSINVIAQLCGFGKGREAALRGLVTQGVKIKKILDVTPIAHNGCKPPKMRRL